MEENKAEGKSVVKYTEWKLEGDEARGYSCVRYTTETVDGNEGAPTASRTVRVPRPDLTGADLEPAHRLCARFGFNFAELADSCRNAEYTRVAKAWLRDLIEQDKRESMVA